MMTKRTNVWLAGLVLSCLALASGCMPEGTRAMVAPFAGENRNELTMGGGPMGPMVLTDTAPEVGLFAMFMHPNIIVNDSLFVTEPNDTEVMGNTIMVNAYGSPDAVVTWNAGAGHTRLTIETAGPTVDISVPLIKGGMVWRPVEGLSVNPYIAHAWDGIETPSKYHETQAFLYGITLHYRWRMIQTTLKYYLTDDYDAEEMYRTYRLRMTVGLTKSVALFLRAEHMEHSVTTDDGFVMGAAFVF